MELVYIDELVPKDHLLRKIDKAINFSFIHDKVKDLYCADNGRPAIDPVILFKENSPSALAQGANTPKSEFFSTTALHNCRFYLAQKNFYPLTRLFHCSVSFYAKQTPVWKIRGFVKDLRCARYGGHTSVTSPYPAAVS